MKTRQAGWGLSFFAFASTALLPRQADARACSVASDCPMGFSCESGGVAADGGPAGTCVSLPCQSNSDCGSGFACDLDLGTECVTTPDSGQTCELASACVPQWDVPCVTATDCGPGYTCQPATGASYNCGKGQDASEPPYLTVTIVPCSAVPTPPNLFDDASVAPGFPAISPICDAGSTCTKVTWNTCVARQTGPCSDDSDCASTWTCGCETTCSAVPPPPTGVPAVDAGCTMACIAPNSDLAIEVCNGAALPAAVGSTPESSAPSDSGVDAAGASGSSSIAGSAGGSGGCQIGSNTGGAPWTLVMTGILAAARWRAGRKRRGAR
jgi:hypothetical protein